MQRTNDTTDKIECKSTCRAAHALSQTHVQKRYELERSTRQDEQPLALANARNRGTAMQALMGKRFASLVHNIIQFSCGQAEASMGHARSTKA
ncbi:hypothetical protein [Paraburkholderia sp. J8-2]|uniref:hypothetical protein n=1 Tax=Paraburkholderia sp. J8-2 TaxID=2805440 RepID=UPI002AB7BE35|nr:hypothetical protein [Paraburkholderia sp. J8-2]